MGEMVTVNTHTFPDTKIRVDYYPSSGGEGRGEFWCLNIGHSTHIMMRAEFIHSLARVMENLEAQLMLREMVEKETDGEPSCP